LGETVEDKDKYKVTVITHHNCQFVIILHKSNVPQTQKLKCIQTKKSYNIHSNNYILWAIQRHV